MLLTAARVFTACGDDVDVDRVVEVDDGRIIDIRLRRRGDDGGLVDLGDVTLLPGLIDAHVHLALDASPDPVASLSMDDDATLLLKMRLAAQRALAVGVTTVRDLGDRNYLALTLRNWFAGGGEVGPRILASGPPITTVRGHCWFLGGEADGIEGVRQAVRERAARGVDVVKLMASGGNLTPTVPPHQSQFGRDHIAVALEEAHSAGLPLAVHAHGVAAVLDALEVGVDSIEHCTLFTADGVDSRPDVLARIAAGGCTISVTAATLPVPRDLLPPPIALRIEAIAANMVDLVKAGARVVCSSDAGVGPPKPHDVLPHGVSDFLPAIGLSNAEAIKNVTVSAAELCGIADLTGTLEVGKEADFLAVRGNPLADIRAIHDVVGVWARGHRVR